MNDWGDRLEDVDRHQEAYDAHRKARARLEKLAAAFPDTPDYRADVSIEKPCAVRSHDWNAVDSQITAPASSAQRARSPTYFAGCKLAWCR